MSCTLTFTGADRSGILAQILSSLDPGTTVRDIQQTVMHGRLALSITVDDDQQQAASEIAANLGVDFKVSLGDDGTDDDRPTGALVVVLAPDLTSGDLAQVARVIAQQGGNIGGLRRIADYPVTAVELRIEDVDATDLKSALGSIAGRIGLDVAVQSADVIQQGAHLLVMDVDSTLIQDEVIDLIAEHAGCGDAVAAVTARAMAGELDFAESLQERVAALAGTPESALDAVRSSIRLTPGARTLCRTLRSLGYRIALVSGGFEEIVGPLAESLGVHRFRANRLEVIDGHLTGRVIPPIVDRPGKAAALREFAQEFGFPMSRTVAIGDGANDLDMISAAGLGVAFNAKPAVAAAADASVNVPYLDSVLYLLGVTRSQVEALSDQLDQA